VREIGDRPRFFGDCESAGAIEQNVNRGLSPISSILNYFQVDQKINAYIIGLTRKFFKR